MELDEEYKQLLLEEQEEDRLNKMSAPRTRLTSLKMCNRRLGIEYTMSLGQDSIKSYMYYYNKRLVLIVWCKTWKDMKEAIWLYGQIQIATTMEQVKELVNKVSNEVEIRS